MLNLSIFETPTSPITTQPLTTVTQPLLQQQPPQQQLAYIPCAAGARRCDISPAAADYEATILNIHLHPPPPARTRSIQAADSLPPSITKPQPQQPPPPPPKVSADACRHEYTTRGQQSPQQQLDTIVAKWPRDTVNENSNNEPAGGFTIVDAAYTPVMATFHSMLDEYKHASRFIYVALDEISGTTACTLGALYIRFDTLENYATMSKPLRIATAKFDTSRMLAAANIFFFFMEMDVFLLGNMNAVFATRSHYGCSFSVHYRGPPRLNIGVYACRGKENVASYWRAVLDVQTRFPKSWDQEIVQWTFRRTCADLQHKYYTQSPHMQHHCKTPLRIGRLALEHVVSGPQFHVQRNTFAVHVLTTSPLKGAHKKLVMGREHMLWPSYRQYYGSAEPNGPRFIAFDGVVHLGNRYFPRTPHLESHIALLVALAALTNRTVIWPTMFPHRAFAWAINIVAVESVEALGVEWRETSFLRNSRVLPAHVHPISTIVFGAEHLAHARWSSPQQPPATNDFLAYNKCTGGTVTGSRDKRAPNTLTAEEMICILVSLLRQDAHDSKLVLLRVPDYDGQGISNLDGGHSIPVLALFDMLVNHRVSETRQPANITTKQSLSRYPLLQWIVKTSRALHWCCKWTGHSMCYERRLETKNVCTTDTKPIVME